MICDFCQYFNKGRCMAQKDAPVMLPEYNIVHCDVYDRTFMDLTPPGEDNNYRKADNNMGYSNKAKAAEANADQKKDLFTIDQINVTRAAEVKEDVVMFDMEVRGIKIYGMCLRHYKNDKGEGDIISFPSKQAKDGKYWDVAWFPISNDLKAGLIDKIVSLLG